MATRCIRTKCPPTAPAAIDGKRILATTAVSSYCSKCPSDDSEFVFAVASDGHWETTSYYYFLRIYNVVFVFAFSLVLWSRRVFNTAPPNHQVAAPECLPCIVPDSRRLFCLNERCTPSMTASRRNPALIRSPERLREPDEGSTVPYLVDGSHETEK